MGQTVFGAGIVKPTAYHLVVETTSDESIFNIFSPTVKINKAKVITTKHVQVARHVFVVTKGEDVYYKGTKLDHAVGLREALGALMPGKQLTTKPNGKTGVLLAYAGKKNILEGSLLSMEKRSINLGYVTIFGTDPVPFARLHARAGMPWFQTQDGNLVAAAYVNSDTRFVRPIQISNTGRLLKDFLHEATR